jgi:hypothetical protein
VPVVATGDGLEEPYRFGDDRNFSPPGLGVRNSFVGPAVITRFGDNSSQYSPITDASPAAAVALKGVMLECYNNSAASHTLTGEDKSNITDVTKKHILGKLKFVQNNKDFGSFWKPDLLKDTQPYVDVFFNSYGSKYHDRKTNESTLRRAAELWKAAAPVIKKMIDNHRAAVAQKMKTDVMTGKIIVEV